MSADSQRQQALAELEGRLAETQEQAAWYTHKHQAAVKRVDQLKVRFCTHCVGFRFALGRRLSILL